MHPPPNCKKDRGKKSGTPSVLGGSVLGGGERMKTLELCESLVSRSGRFALTAVKSHLSHFAKHGRGAGPT